MINSLVLQIRPAGVDGPLPSSVVHDQIIIPACFTSGEKMMDDSAGVTKSGQSVFMSVYRTKIADQCRLITITWCKNMLLHGLSVSVEGPEGESQYTCKVELKPWYFWRKQGSKRFVVEGKPVDIFWDLKAAKFNGETEPSSEYYVAVVYDEEVVLLTGDLKKDAYRKTGCRPALIDPILVSRKEHIFGKKKFCTKVKFHEKGRLHEISIECKSKCNISGNLSSNGGDLPNGIDPEMEIRIDGQLVINVKHLQWKFRGNESIHMNKVKVEVYWDVHDWLFNPVGKIEMRLKFRGPFGIWNEVMRMMKIGLRKNRQSTWDWKIGVGG
ncbi:OLC1v1001219C1 [Oldenlandia corymbosa var. corymbosa]|uniref:OLC1v1001219C1 n=1 Tax=Oldenlandia corymbosa var. corymbosa TaxID=529605 RepID=A0AAV1D4U5_OLDCO|nr:OLC1v1001219C1 [Oldenlandia corymbosa var. corymbosa]